MSNLENALESIMQMDFETREMLLEILQKRQVEERRKEIAKNGRTAKRAFESGKTKAEHAGDLVKRLKLTAKR